MDESITGNLLMSSSTECQLTFFSQSHYDDKSTISLLKESFPDGFIYSSIEDASLKLNRIQARGLEQQYNCAHINSP